MQCPNCQHMHPAPARFCAQCGSPLPGNATPGGLVPGGPVPGGPVPGGPVSGGPVSGGPVSGGPVPRGPVPGGPVPGGPVPRGPVPGTSPYGSPVPQFGPVAQNRTLLGLPVYVWLLGVAGIALIATLLPWYSATYSAQVGWQTTGYDYGAAGRSTWDVPVTSGSFSGGGNGFGFFTFVLTAAIAGLAIAFRAGVWPRWASITLAVVVGVVLLVGIANLAFDPHIGPFLFAAAGGMAVPAVIQTLRRQA